jgi:mono/diheme cytochrome c family protein
MKNLASALALTLLIAVSAQAKSEHQLSIKMQEAKRTFTVSQLLKSKNKTTIKIEKDPAYPGQVMKYTAVPASELFNGLEIPTDSTIQFNCLDGFSAPLHRDRLLSTAKDAAIPYIAIETKKWPALKNKKVSAGPFYLVWLDPEKSKVGPEEWPYQLAGFEIKPPLRAQYPEIFPDSKLSSDHAANRGAAVFAKQCFACHTMNGKGTSAMGPDLNLPRSPTEYLARGYLEKLIRNPQQLRQWPQSKMNSFGKDVISDTEMSDLIAYLTQMAKQRGELTIETAVRGHKRQ